MDSLGGQIFSGELGSNADSANPYAPTGSNSGTGQFKVPLDILNAAADVHGQIEGQYLDDLFDYTPIGTSSGIEISGGALRFSNELKDLFIQAFVYNSINERIEFYQECVDDESVQVYERAGGKNPPNLVGGNRLNRCEGDCDNFNSIKIKVDECGDGLLCFERDTGGDGPPGCGGNPLKDGDYCYSPFCSQQKERLEDIRNGLDDQGLSSSTFFDESIALLFGNGTTVGQVCAYARALTATPEPIVDDIPGFCCLDAPYQADDWGEIVSNILVHMQAYCLYTLF